MLNATSCHNCRSCFERIFKYFAILLCFFSYHNSNAQWLIDSSGMGNKTVTSLALSGNNFYAGTFLGWGVYLSTNNGGNWNQTSLINQDVPSLAINGNTVFAGTRFNGIYTSLDNGNTWTQTNLTSQNVHSIAVNGNNIFAGTFNGVFLSINNGLTWNQTSLNNRRIWSLAISGNKIFAGAENNGIYVSTDNGTVWTHNTLMTGDIRSLLVNGNNIFAGTGLSGVYKSSDNGLTWTQTPMNFQSVWCLATDGSNIFAGCIDSPQFYVSTDNGTSWTAKAEGISGNNVFNALLIYNNFIYAGSGIGLYKRPLSEIVGIKQISFEVPDRFSLSQNYPNPFNPTTNLEFGISELGLVTLKVYNTSGKEVATIVNEVKPAGYYTVSFNGANLSSGIYFYSIKAGNFSTTKRMLLIK